MIDVFLLENHPVTELGVKCLIHKSRNFRLVGYRNRTDNIVSLCLEKHPHIVVLADNIPRADPLLLIKIIKKRRCGKCVVYGESLSTAAVRAMLFAGASGYVWKGDSRNELLNCLRTVAMDRAYLSSSVNVAVMKERFLGKAVCSERLTGCELYTVKMIAEGKNPKLIAGDLGVSVTTAYHYRRCAMRKLRVSSNAELIKRAISVGISPLN